MKSIARRSLVHAAAIVPFQAVVGSAQNSAIKVGLIGAGSRGTYTAGMVAKDPRAKVTAVCDVVDEQIAKAKQKIGAPDAKGRRRSGERARRSGRTQTGRRDHRAPVFSASR